MPIPAKYMCGYGHVPSEYLLLHPDGKRHRYNGDIDAIIKVAKFRSVEWVDMHETAAGDEHKFRANDTRYNAEPDGVHTLYITDNVEQDVIDGQLVLDLRAIWEMPTAEICEKRDMLLHGKQGGGY